jgi:hypothetical protein
MRSAVGLIARILSGMALLQLAAGCSDRSRDEYVVDSLAVVEAVRLARSIAPEVLVDPTPLVPEPDWMALDSTDYADRDRIARMRILLLTELGVEMIGMSDIASCYSQTPGVQAGAGCPTSRQCRVGVALSRPGTDTQAGDEGPVKLVRVLVQDADSLVHSTLVYDLTFVEGSSGGWSFQFSRVGWRGGLGMGAPDGQVGARPRLARFEHAMIHLAPTKYSGVGETGDAGRRPYFRGLPGGSSLSNTSRFLAM